ncbi:unnamed protein product, partial [Arctogadus glacialis]
SISSKKEEGSGQGREQGGTRRWSGREAEYRQGRAYSEEMNENMFMASNAGEEARQRGRVRRHGSGGESQGGEQAREEGRRGGTRGRANAGGQPQDSRERQIRERESRREVSGEEAKKEMETGKHRGEQKSKQQTGGKQRSSAGGKRRQSRGRQGGEQWRGDRREQQEERDRGRKEAVTAADKMREGTDGQRGERSRCRGGAEHGTAEAGAESDRSGRSRGSKQ